MIRNIRTLFVATLSLAMMYGTILPAVASNKINVLVIDSGTDFTHKLLKPKARPNLPELNGKKGVDDDKNGYIDDIYGWNFVENNNILVNLYDTPPQYDKLLKIMEYLGRLQAYGKEDFTKDEWNWLATNYNDPAIQPWIGFIGGWAHGTHCAGIIADKNNAVSLNAIRHIATGAAPKFIQANLDLVNLHFADKRQKEGRSLEDSANEQRVSMADLEAYFKQLGAKNARDIQKKAAYIASMKPRLINCSFGSENSTLVAMMKKNMTQWGFLNPTDKEIQQVVNLFVKHAFLPRDVALFSGCKDALVFIAAGNSSENLDPFITSPNNVPIENKIVIGATDMDRRLAAFSCYGAKTVDVAVPGVNIYATYPNNKMGYMSGTSMACPMALRYASMVLNENPNLTPVQLKKILMGTVDKKDWLKGKVRTSGVINDVRAIYAAKQVKQGRSIDEAIQIANKKVKDKAVRTFRTTSPDLSDPEVRAMYMTVF